MSDAATANNGQPLKTRYVLRERLGVGGQGEVWRAFDPQANADIALKILHPAPGRSAAAWAALVHEHESASRLDHPGILKVYPPERDGKTFLLPMELATGGDLKRLRGAGYLTIVPVLIEAARALQHAHERGVIHRDLKPGNVLFDERGREKLADFGVSFLMFLAMLIYYGTRISAAVIWLPVFLLLAVLTALGVGLWLSALNAMYRDVRYVVPFLVQFWMFASPVVYPSSLVPQKWRWLYGLNPMAGVIEGFRWSLGRGNPPGRLVLVSTGVMILILLSGIAYFQKMETTIADVV